MVEKKGVCGTPSRRYPELKLTCCVAYVPKGMGGNVLGIPIRGADGPHRHMDVTALADGTLLAYFWGGYPEYQSDSWAMMPVGKQMAPCTQAEWEKALAEIGRRPRSGK